MEAKGVQIGLRKKLQERLQIMQNFVQQRYFATVTPLVIEDDVQTANGNPAAVVIAEQNTGKEGIVSFSVAGKALDELKSLLSVGEPVRLFLSRKGAILDAVGLARPRAAAE